MIEIAIIMPNRRWVTEVVTGKAAPALFAVAYIAIVIAVFPRAEGSFSTLAGVTALSQISGFFLPAGCTISRSIC